jgi:hypothetical protein
MRQADSARANHGVLVEYGARAERRCRHAAG